MPENSPLRVSDATILPEWVDYNGHMNVAFYVLVFDRGTDAFLAEIDMTEARRDATGSSVFVAEAHITYDQEVMQDEQVHVTSQVLGVDEKRLHLFHRMYRTEDETLVATNELMILHVNLNNRRVSPFSEAVQGHLGRIWDQHKSLPKPDKAGSIIAVPISNPQI